MSSGTRKIHPRPAPLVCIVDPDAVLARRLAELLQGAGAEVRVFGSGAALLAAAAPAPACIISEMRLPDTTGIELIGALRAREISSPVILLADDGEVATAVAAMRAGALDFIEKPHVDRLLVWHIRRLLDNDEPGDGPDAG